MKILTIFSFTIAIIAFVVSFCFAVVAPLMLAETNPWWLAMYIPYLLIFFTLATVIFDFDECEEREDNEDKIEN
jgi:hypothetical protein